MKLVHVFKAAENAGAEIYENTTVASIEEGREHLLHTTGRTYRQGKVVGIGDQFHLKTGILPKLVCARP